MPTTLNLNEKLSPHFTLHEMLTSQTAIRKNITEQFEPPEEILENLTFLCNNLLEQIREIHNRALMISSGYRCPRLNRAVGGVRRSQHLRGQAADIDLGSIEANARLFEKIKNSDLEFDQLLNEFNFSWVHISKKKDGNRRDIRNITK